jgi:hypothetical protein
MSLVDAVIAVGARPPQTDSRADKKRYSELLSSHLALEVAEGLRDVGSPGVRPERGGAGERAFQGGLGPKKVDVTFSDERHGLLLAVSIKTINFAPFGKNLKNRFADLCTEAITLHMRFPYSVVCALFAFPCDADEDRPSGRGVSTFKRATTLFASICGREDYTSPGEKFESVTMMLFQPAEEGDTAPWVRLIDTQTGNEMTEEEYFRTILRIYNRRNPHVPIGSEVDEDDRPEHPS